MWYSHVSVLLDVCFPCCLCVLCLIFRVMFCHEAEEPVTRFRFFHEEPLVILMLIKMSFCPLMKSVMMHRCDAHIWIQRNKNTEKLMLFLFINDNLLIHSCKTIINSSFLFSKFAPDGWVKSCNKLISSHTHIVFVQEVLGILQSDLRVSLLQKWRSGVFRHVAH